MKGSGSMIRFVVAGVFAVSVLFLLLSPAVAQSTAIGGVYSLGNFFTKDILSNTSVTGLSLRIGWNQIQTQKGVYDWSFLDSNIRKASTYGKKVMIRVFAGKCTPQWVYGEGAVPYTFVDTDGVTTLTMPLPWDSVYLQNWRNFIITLGKRYARKPQVVLIHVTGPCEDGEMYLPESDNQERWLQLGYSEQKLTGAWMTTIDAYALAFPNTSLAINISRPVSFGNSMGVVQDVLSYAYSRLGQFLRVQGNWLSAKTSPDFTLFQIVINYANYTNVGFQMLCPASDVERFGGTLRQGIDNGLNAGASYLEIYGSDIRNPTYKDDIIYADYNLKLNEK